MARALSPLLVIVGETASGKSDLAIQLAQMLGGEIICADSWTVRQEVNIGTAKPSAHDRQLVPHHLLDIVGPDEDFTAAVFKGLANQAITDIHARGKLPIMVGGSGLYVDGVIYDYGFLPAGERTGRIELNSLSQAQLLSRIKQQGVGLASIDVNNKRRLIRLIETNGAQPTKHELRPNTVIIGLQTKPELLAQRITERVDAMLAAGLEGEVRRLVEKYGWDCEALKGISYAQWRAYFEGRANLEQTRQAIIKATKDLAKRQRTWFKRSNSIHWFSTPVNQSEAVELVTTLLET